ncbi:variant erythrocyte surface antigen-1 family protein [Babesia caballi]|uniref:Variant erythrocyte surface antigen-1 family protein n=1 Tax=Babesia caballi TaxID=5871 RepID=A0AAV4LQU2_BABCB|nr:variant erythrocyte surface antigen-1 family protein [Babesia caballi]
MMSEKNSLKDPATSLKEAIDWITWNGLKDSVENLPAFSEAFSGNFGKVRHPDSFIYKLADNLGKGFLGYEAQGTDDFSGDGIVKKVGSKYQSAYHGGSWVQGPVNDYAKIFLFLASLAFYFVSFFYWMCKSSGKWADNMLSDSGPFSKFFEAMGYTPGHLRNINRSEIASALEHSHNGFAELSDAYKGGGASSYENFLTSLNQKASENPLFRPPYQLQNILLCVPSVQAEGQCYHQRHRCNQGAACHSQQKQRYIRHQRGFSSK